jgi:hypothetical protein
MVNGRQGNGRRVGGKLPGATTASNEKTTFARISQIHWQPVWE